MRKLFKNKIVTINIVGLLVLAGLLFMGARYEVMDIGVLNVRTIAPLHPSTTIALTGAERARMIDLTALYFAVPVYAGYVKPELDGTTAPGFATPDSVLSLVYANSTETASIAYGFRVPYDYSGGLGFRIILSSDVSSPATVGWDLLVNADDTAFATSHYQQTAGVVAGTNLSVSNEIMTLTANTTALAQISAGKWVRVAFWNQTTHVPHSATTTLEIKGIEMYYTPRQ